MELRAQFDTKCKAIFKKLIEDQLAVIKRAQLEAKNDSINDNIQQKQKHRCGPFKESELPLELLIQYRKKHQNKMIESVDGRNHNNNLAKIAPYISDIPKSLKELYELYGFFLS